VPRAGIVALLTAALCVACALPPRPLQPLQAPQATAAAYVIVGAEGQAVARLLTDAAQCPALQVDGATVPMQTRSGPQTVAQRPTQSAPALSKPSVFALRVCELALPAGTRRASLDGRALPLPTPVARRIVVIGDTGCRIKQSDHAFQDCGDQDAWPFAQVARAAAATHPDLVIHVGDYHYRETPCPPERPGCRASPWGYGSDAWQADLFAPAAPLLAAAPWVVLRGNHEECTRAGQGWFRFLDPAPFEAHRSCDRAADDDEADYSPPYAVPLGGGQQLIVFDSARAGNRPLDPAKPKDARTLAAYIADMQVVDTLAARTGQHSFFLSHHPVLAFAASASGQLYGGNPALQAAMRSLHGTAYFPAGVEAALHGHVHLFQALDFASGQPPTLVAGNGGDNLDALLPATLPPGTTPADGVVLKRITHAGRFGFLVMDRQNDAPDSGWHLSARRSDGSVLAECELAQRQLHCDRTGMVD
jgi:hypothetical protein